MNKLNYVEAADPEVAKVLALELERQQNNLELIASENIVSPAVMAAQGSVLTNKYAEGYAGRRYYGGCQCVDIAENIACDRAKELFGAEYVNVQPHSGSQANTAIYFSFLTPGDKVLGMNLSHGGHLTHGNPINISGKLYHFVPYGVDKDTEQIDYDELAALALREKPRMIVAGASAYPRFFDFPRLKAIADDVGAYLMVDMAHVAGLVAAGLHPSPIPYADFVTTTTHKTLRGPRGGMIFAKAKYGAKLDKAIFPGIQGGPLMHVIAAKAVAFGEALRPEFKEYQQQVLDNAQALAAALVDAGYRIVSGGTDNHLLLVDLRGKNLTGAEAETMLDEVNITVNKNTIPFDPQNPNVTSGIRIGTPAVTTRGMGKEDMRLVAKAMDLTLSKKDPAEAKGIVRELTQKYPLYQDEKGVAGHEKKLG